MKVSTSVLFLRALSRGGCIPLAVELDRLTQLVVQLCADAVLAVYLIERPYFLLQLSESAKHAPTFAFEESRLERIELKEPVANEKEITPMIMRQMQIMRSVPVPPDMSPKPTVVMVVTVK